MAAINKHNITVGDVLNAIFKNDHNKTYMKFLEDITKLVDEIYKDDVNRSTNTLSIYKEEFYENDYDNLASLLARYATIGVTQRFAQGSFKYGDYVQHNKTNYHFSETEKQQLNKWLENHPMLKTKYDHYIREYTTNQDGGRRRSKRSHRKTRKGKSQKHRSKGGRRGKSRKH